MKEECNPLSNRIYGLDEGGIIMGLFDEVAQQENEKISIAITEKVVKDLYLSYLETYKKLEMSPNYSSIFNREMDKAFYDFEHYFKAKGFNIYPAQFSNGEGRRAVMGDFKVEFYYQSNGEFFCNIRGLEYERLILNDKTAENRLFQGYIHDDELVLLGNVTDENKLEYLGKAAKDIKADIDRLKSKIDDQYEPSFIFELGERQRNVNSVTEYLEIVNEEVSNK
jgi:hypothetical protein